MKSVVNVQENQGKEMFGKIFLQNSSFYLKPRNCKRSEIRKNFQAKQVRDHDYLFKASIRNAYATLKVPPPRSFLFAFGRPLHFKANVLFECSLTNF